MTGGPRAQRRGWREVISALGLTDAPRTETVARALLCMIPRAYVDILRGRDAEPEG